MGRLFGTGGAKGIVNTNLAHELAMNVDRAAATILGKGGKCHPRILIGKNTRISSGVLESMLATGLCGIGANMVYLGVVPTPAVAYLVEKYGADADMIISASYNPYEFSGIKIFSSAGYKLPGALEEWVETIVLDCEERPQFPTGGEVGPISAAPQALRDHMGHARSMMSENTLKGLRVTLDYANGFSVMTTQTLFTELGAECHMLSDASNGVSISGNCGPTRMETLMQYVEVNYIDAGLAFDDDVDRCLAMDEQGQLVDGDFLVTTCVLNLKSQDRLAKNAAVGTIMTSMGSICFYEENGVKFAATKVSDRYVPEEMLQEGYNLDGGQSGHIISLDYATTDDGQVTGMQLLIILGRRRAYLSSLATLMTRYPQIMISVIVSREGKLHLYTDAEVNEATERAKARLDAEGRVVVRPFGTESLPRVMIESENHDEISTSAYEVADVVHKRLA